MFHGRIKQINFIYSVISTKMVAINQLLEKIYKNPKSPGSYGGVWPLFLAAKKRMPSIKFKQVEKWLKNQDTYTLHKQAYRNF